MRKNTLKLLLILYSSGQKPLWLDYQQLSLALSDSSYVTLRSLVSQMKKKGLVHTEQMMNKTQVCLTEAGKRNLELEFPAFLPISTNWNGQLSCVVFLKAPKNDKQFRYLRGLLLAMNFIAISKGVYVYPGKVSVSLVEECRNSYQNSVLIFSINNYIFGSLQAQIIKKQALAKLAENYSGISREINHLLSLNRQAASFSDQEKQQFSSVFNWLFENVSCDQGLLNYYFPQVVSAQQLLTSLQQILTTQ